ncbi:MAG TPA: hypothetical protein VFY11_06050 [Nocardioidaceae bacterium]|nr:hypothetical protein [Nocardioidaceae bacterium]
MRPLPEGNEEVAKRRQEVENQIAPLREQYPEGGDVLYLCHWMRHSGLADLLPTLGETVWVGLGGREEGVLLRVGVVNACWFVMCRDRRPARTGRNPCTPGPVRQFPARIGTGVRANAPANAPAAACALDVTG